MSAFEIISKEEFEDSVAVFDPDANHGKPPDGEGTATECYEQRLHSGAQREGSDAAHPLHYYPLTWCEFCKGYYIMEYHFGRRDDTGRDSSED